MKDETKITFLAAGLGFILTVVLLVFFLSGISK